MGAGRDAGVRGKKTVITTQTAKRKEKQQDNYIQIKK